MAQQHIAVFDPEAFYPFRRMVEGPLRPGDLQAIERFVRAIVLHDEMVMMHVPLPFEPESYYETIRQHPEQKNIIVALAPVITSYNDLLSRQRNLNPEGLPNISHELLALASDFANAGEGNPYYESHVRFLQQMLSVEKGFGSAVCEGRFAQAAELKAKEFPNNLFRRLDQDWKDYAQAVDSGYLGPVIPPVLSIALTRCQSREHIPTILSDLRSEWAIARKKVWDLIRHMQNAATLREANEVRRQLDEASEYFSPKQTGNGMSPTRVLWKLVEDVPAGAISAVVSGGDPTVGAVVGGAKGVLATAAATGAHFANTLFGRGAFDLARRMHQETMKVETMPKLLSRLLTQAEKEAFGL